jgi:hypothetical protein
MKTYIISYDLSNPGKNYEDLLKKIKSYSWARLGGSAYVVVSANTAVEIRDNLKTVLDSNDKLFVGTVVPQAAWTGLPEEVSKWLINNIK